MKRKTKSMMPKANIEDRDIIVFQGEKPVAKAGEVELHLFGSNTPGTLFGRSVGDVKKDFEKVSGQVEQILENAFTRAPKGVRFDSVEISLGFTAKGKLAFIAEAGVQASVTVTFKRET
ncbi:MAG TPA: CU044_2847 family protein [Candidatus Acidoferrales bacterium]|nr:CU044_2847 family protein [Candidatus Acidoferrales bacterium]